MDQSTTFLLDAGCPWVDLRNFTGLPDVLWCERQLCSWIATPANTWSNLAYVFVGVFFYWFTRKEKSENIRFYGPAAMWVGWTSFIYHASLFYVSQVVDFFGMYIFFFLILAQNFARLGKANPENVKKTVWILSITLTLLSGAAAKAGMRLQPVVMVLIVLILVTEVMASKRAVKKVKHLHLGLSLFFLGVGAAFSASDVTRRFCTPDNHWLQGHALWHVFGSLALLFSIFFYKQFYSPVTGKMDLN